MNGLRPRSGFGFASCLAPCLHFYQLVTLLEISVDQFFFPDKLNGESTCRKQIDVMLNTMDEKELTVMKYTAEGLQKARETEDA